MMSFAVFTLIY